MLLLSRFGDGGDGARRGGSIDPVCGSHSGISARICKMARSVWPFGRFSRLGSLFIVAASVLAISVMVWLLGSSERRIAHVDERNVADLQILTDGLQQWERTRRGNWGQKQPLRGR